MIIDLFAGVRAVNDGNLIFTRLDIEHVADFGHSSMAGNVRHWNWATLTPMKLNSHGLPMTLHAKWCRKRENHPSFCLGKQPCESWLNHGLRFIPRSNFFSCTGLLCTCPKKRLPCALICHMLASESGKSSYSLPSGGHLKGGKPMIFVPSPWTGPSPSAKFGPIQPLVLRCRQSKKCPSKLCIFG